MTGGAVEEGPTGGWNEPRCGWRNAIETQRPGRSIGCLQNANVRGLKALLALRDFKFDLLVLVKIPEAGPSDRAEMHEYVRTTILLGDESKTLVPVEPLDSSDSHEALLIRADFLQGGNPPYRIFYQSAKALDPVVGHNRDRGRHQGLAPVSGGFCPGASTRFAG
jgi:hypothetical protein